MFAMVVLFGLFHGLVFLPVLLSLVGPSSPPMPMYEVTTSTASKSATIANGLNGKLNGIMADSLETQDETATTSL